MIFTSEINARLVAHEASDEMVVAAARVSTIGSGSEEYITTPAEESQGLINFLMKNRHGTPFEHNMFTVMVEAPIVVFREWHRHRIGWCLAGDTEVWCETISENHGRTLRKRPIAELYRNWHEGVPDSLGRNRRLSSCRNFTVRTLDEETGLFHLSKVTDIYANGVKPVLAIETDNGETLRATGDHAVWTPGGWAKLGDLGVGDQIGRNGRVSMSREGSIPPSLRRGIGVWTSMQRAALIGEGGECYLCLGSFAAPELVLDHVIPVVADLQKALDVSNLKPACEPCHRAKTNSEQALASRGMTSGVRWTKITKMEPGGEVPTYDLELEGPSRGFVANGLVVHNSYNEESGRYKQLAAKFYIPPPERPLVQVGKPGHYTFVPGSKEQYERQVRRIKRQCLAAYKEYEDSLDDGVAKEVARGVLPFYTYSSMYATFNARSAMAFLSLRVQDEGSMFKSFPMWEIDHAARQVEEQFAELMPITHEAFVANGRVCP